MTEKQVTQGYGSARASAGYHSPEGNIEGHPYSSCVDLTWGLVSTPGIKDHLIAGSFCPFFRYTDSFEDNKHIHCVFVGARDDSGRVKILPGPREQILDYTQGKNGLSNHGPLTGDWAPTPNQREQIYEQYANWIPDISTQVFSPEGYSIPCYAFLEGSVVRCEARLLLEFWDVEVGWDGIMTATYKGQRLDLSSANLRVEGDYTRGNVRQLVEAVPGLIIQSYIPGEYGDVVRIGYQ